MPAVTDRSSLPPLESPDRARTRRPVEHVRRAIRTTEGAGFVVRRPIPGIDPARSDPFLLLDHMGPVTYAPREAVGAPDHPHRGFETVTYLLDGELEHKDSHGGGGVLRAGDTQWMTAGAGLVHSEMPSERIRRHGGTVHGVQLWVNLPAADKFTPPRYQDLRADLLTRLRSPDGGALVRLIAGSLGDHEGPGRTHTPITYAHASIDPGHVLEVPWDPEQSALLYVLSGEGRAGPDATPVAESDLAVLGEGEVVSVAGEGAEPLEVLLLGGRPLREPVAQYGPFVMTTKAQIAEAIDDYHAGRMGRIAARTG